MRSEEHRQQRTRSQGRHREHTGQLLAEQQVAIVLLVLTQALQHRQNAVGRLAVITDSRGLDVISMVLFVPVAVSAGPLLLSLAFTPSRRS